MKHIKWGIEGYIVLMNQKPIGQFDSAGWAYEFQQMASNKHMGVPIGILSSESYCTMVTDEKEPAANEELKEKDTTP